MRIREGGSYGRVVVTNTFVSDCDLGFGLHKSNMRSYVQGRLIKYFTRSIAKGIGSLGEDEKERMGSSSSAVTPAGEPRM